MPVFFGAGRGRLTFVKVLSLANKQVKRSGIVSRSAREPPIMRRTALPSLFKKNKTSARLVFIFLAQEEGFEPPWAFTQTVFKTASL